jgi:hypothetical protein
MANGTQGWCMAKPHEYELWGIDREGRKVFHVRVEAVNEVVAKLYATVHLERTPDGADAVRSAVKIEAHAASPSRVATRSLA